MRPVLGLLACLTGVAVPLGAAAAEDYPARPIQIVVPWPPGAIDVYVRMIKTPMEQDLGQTCRVGDGTFAVAHA